MIKPRKLMAGDQPGSLAGPALIASLLLLAACGGGGGEEAVSASTSAPGAADSRNGQPPASPPASPSPTVDPGPDGSDGRTPAPAPSPANDRGGSRAPAPSGSQTLINPSTAMARFTSAFTPAMLALHEGPRLALATAEVVASSALVQIVTPPNRRQPLRPRLTLPANNCQVSGTMDVTVNDLDQDGRLSTGDDLNVTMNACDGGVGLANRAFQLKMTDLQRSASGGLSVLDADLQFDSFRHTGHGSFTSGLLGHTAVSYRHGSGTTSMTVQARTLTVADGRKTWKLVDYRAGLSVDGGVATTLYRGVIGNGTAQQLSFETAPPLQRASADLRVLTAGGFTVTARDGSIARLVVEGENRLRLEACENATSSCTDLGGVSWTDIFTAAQATRPADR